MQYELVWLRASDLYINTFIAATLFLVKSLILNVVNYYK